MDRNVIEGKLKSSLVSSRLKERFVCFILFSKVLTLFLHYLLYSYRSDWESFKALQHTADAGETAQRIF